MMWAVIFDLDGVLVSTDGCHYRGWQRLADEIGVPFDRQRNEALRGVDRMNSLLRLLPANHGFGAAELEALAERKNGYYRELIAGLTPADVLPGSLELLDALAAAGVPRAVASASRNAAEVLERLGIRERFGAVVTGHDFQRGKPAPDVFLAAAARLGVAPAHCVVVEDAVSGIAAARAAAMRVVGIGAAGHEAGADRTVSGVAELDVATLRGLVAGG